MMRVIRKIGNMNTNIGPYPRWRHSVPVNVPGIMRHLHLGDIIENRRNFFRHDDVGIKEYLGDWV